MHRGLSHPGGTFADNLRTAQFRSSIRAASERDGLQNSQVSSIHQKSAWLVYVTDHINYISPAHCYCVAGKNRNVAVGVITDVPCQWNGHGLVWLIAVNHHNTAACFITKPACGGDQIKQMPIPQNRVDTRMANLSQHACALRSVFINEQGDVRVI